MAKVSASICIASESKNTVSASAKETLCFFRLCFAKLSYATLRQLFRNSIARGTGDGTENYGINLVNQFDPRDLNSISLKPDNVVFIQTSTKRVLANGGILSIHAHNNDGVGPELEKVIHDFTTQRRVLYIKYLIGYGKPY